MTETGKLRMTFTLTADELKGLLIACNPPRPRASDDGVGELDGSVPLTPQERANVVWQALGRRHGFDWLTVRPVEGQGPEVFTAEVALRGVGVNHDAGHGTNHG